MKKVEEEFASFPIPLPLLSQTIDRKDEFQYGNRVLRPWGSSTELR
jgi:hypothetical protein